MEFTKAEVSEDGKVVKLTISGEHLPDEVYYVRWSGGGQLNVTSCFELDAATTATFPAGT